MAGKIRVGVAGAGFIGAVHARAYTRVPRVELVGPLPEEIQTYNVFTAAIPATAKERAATNEFLRFLSSDRAKAVLRLGGVDPD